MKGFTEINYTYKELEFYFTRKMILIYLKKNILDISGILLDVGCGKKPYKKFFFENSNIDSYLGLDIKEAIEYGGEKPDIFWEDDKIPLNENTINTAIATEVLEHVPNPELFLLEVNRVLKPKGLLLVTIPFLWPLHEIPHDNYRYTPFAIKRILENSGFVDINIQAMGGWNASLGQMIALWTKRSFKAKLPKIIFTIIFYPIIYLLYYYDKKPKIFKESSMITGLGISARKL